MSQSAPVWLVILLALIAANLPFVNQRLLSVIPLRIARKSVWTRLAELLVLYLAVGAVARWLEGRAGQVAAQGWEFFAVTGALFLTLAFPGFVYRYLLKRRD